MERCHALASITIILLLSACSPKRQPEPEPAIGRTQGDGGTNDGSPDTARDHSNPIRNVTSDSTTTR